MAQNDIGIDLGTTTIIIAQEGKGVVLNQPSVVAMDTRKNTVLEAGDKALAMVGRTPNYISAIFPLKDGVISDHTMTRELICRFVKQVYSSHMVKPRVAVCVPAAITGIESDAVVEAVVAAGARQVYLIDEPIAAALGSGIDITLPDGSVVDATQAKYTVDKNGVYNFSVRDYCGNILSYPVEVSNIDRLAPAADYEVMPGDWTNKPVTIRVTATDPEPEDGYAPSGVKSITMPDGTVVEGDAADFTVSVNGTYDFIITDNGGNTATLHAEVGNVDTARPTVDFHFEPLDGGDRTIITEYGKTEYYNYDIIMNASAGDVGSGIERYEYKAGDGEWTVFDPADAPKFMEEQIVHIVVRVWDVAGNVSEEKARDIVLDKTPPTASHTLTPGKDGKVNINLGTDGSICGVQSITRPDGSVAYGVDTLVFEVDRNGDYDFFVWDRCGNLLKYTVPVDSFPAPVEPEPAPSEPEEPKPEPEPESKPDPEPEGPAAPVEVPAREDARALTLADLACTLLSILFAALVWLRGKKDGGEDANDEDEQVDEDVEEDEPRGYAVQKTVNAVPAVLSVVLFFLTQPLVWRFRLVDWWTVLFVLLCGTALAMLIWKRKEENKAEETDEEETEDFAE